MLPAARVDPVGARRSAATRSHRSPVLRDRASVTARVEAPWTTSASLPNRSAAFGGRHLFSEATDDISGVLLVYRHHMPVVTWIVAVDARSTSQGVASAADRVRLGTGSEPAVTSTARLASSCRRQIAGRRREAVSATHPSPEVCREFFADLPVQPGSRRSQTARRRPSKDFPRLQPAVGGASECR